MESWSRRVSLGRLLLSAAFVAFAFVLASWTSARADDKGLLGVVAESVPQVADVTETTTELVRSTTAAAPVGTVDEVVATSVDAASTVAEKPVERVDATSEAIVSPTTKALSHSASGGVVTVKEVAPASETVIDPVVAVVAPVMDTVEAPPVTKPSDVVDAVVDVLEPATTPPATQTHVPGDAAAAPGVSRAVSAAGQGPTATATAPGADLADDPAGYDRRAVTAATAADVVRQPSTQSASGGPASPTPWSPSGLSGVTGGVPSAGSSASGGSELATTPHDLALPQTRSAAAPSRLFTLSRGPALNPGSRPD
ncbi:hypothetical protein LL946_17985 [Knoellia locipacati]|uniref:hypothetical protein n=1 Tax=Knoellia locipacati TaxID=882824 RepID=UPI00384F70E4